MSVRANKDTFESEINEAEKLVIANLHKSFLILYKWDNSFALVDMVAEKSAE